LRADQFGDYNDGSEVRHSDPLALTQLLVAALSRLKSVPEESPVEAVTKH
jgi:hypothetical protein